MRFLNLQVEKPLSWKFQGDEDDDDDDDDDDEWSAFSESPGRETPTLKIWARSEQPQNPISGQSENLDSFFCKYHHFLMIN